MDRVWESGAVSNAPTAPVSLSNGYPTDVAPSTNPGAWWYHMVTEELRNTIAKAGMTPSGTAVDQLATAVALIAKQSVSSGTFAPVRACDTTGVTMSYTQTVDGVALNNGDRVLRAVGTAANNGLWIVNSSGAWTRPNDYSAGTQVPEGMTVEVSEGTSNGGTMWQLQPVTGTLITVGATAVAYANIYGTLNAVFSKYLLSTTAATTYAPLQNPTFAGTVKLSSYNQNAVPFVNSSNALTTSTALTFDGTDLTIGGKLVATLVNVTGNTVPANGIYQPNANTLGFATNTTVQAYLTSLGYFGVGAVPQYQAQITGAGQNTSAYSDSGNVGASLFLQDTVGNAGSGGALLFGTTVGRAQAYAAIKGMLSDTTGGKLGNLAISLRKNSADTSLTEVGRFTSYGNFLFGTTTDPLSSSSGNIVAQNYMYSAQSVATSAGSNGQFLAVGGGGSNWFGAFLKNDGTNAYLGSTAVASSQIGTLTSSAANMQPLYWNLSSGAVTIDGTGAGVSFGGSVTASSPPTGDNSNKLTTSSWVKSAIATAVAGLSSGGSSTSGLTSFNVSLPSFLTAASSTVSTGNPNLTISYSGTPLPVSSGGTGGNSQATAMASLGAYSMANWTGQLLQSMAAVGSWSNTLTFNAPAAGKVIAFGMVNTSPAYASATNTYSATYIGHNLGINGNIPSLSSCIVTGSSSLVNMLYVSAGTAVTITQTIYTYNQGIPPSSELVLYYIFVPATS